MINKVGGSTRETLISTWTITRRARGVTPNARKVSLGSIESRQAGTQTCVSLQIIIIHTKRARGPRCTSQARRHTWLTELIFRVIHIRAGRTTRAFE